MNLVQRTGALAEALILLGLGWYMFDLAGGDAYSQFMNPKYRWLTASTGAGLGLVGLNALFSLRRLPGLGRLALFGVLIFLIGVTGLTPGPEDSAAAREEADPTARQSWLELDGQRYTKITTGELFMLLRKDDAPPEKLEAPYVMRGVVKRSAELDRLGLFTLLRGNMVCCVADSVAVGFYVKGADPMGLEDGDWVRVFGRVENIGKGKKMPDAPRMDGIFYSQAFPDAFLIAHRIEPVPRPASPYMFVVDAEEPYGY